MKHIRQTGSEAHGDCKYVVWVGERDIKAILLSKVKLAEGNVAVHSDMPNALLTLPALLYNEVKVCWLEYRLDQPHKTQGVVCVRYSVRVGSCLQQTS